MLIGIEVCEDVDEVDDAEGIVEHLDAALCDGDHQSKSFAN